MKPTEEQMAEFWKGCGLVHINNPISQEAANSCEAMASDRPVNGWYFPDYSGGTSKLISLRETPIPDLNNLFEYMPEIIVGVYFRFYPGGCECELTYITEAGFDTVKSWVKNETGDENESKKLSALALFWALDKVMKNDKVS